MTANSLHILLPDFFTSALCPQESEDVRITYSFLSGLFFVVIGACIRKWCYIELGKYFTFKVTIQKDHRLITSGPYAYLRHPSYTGALLLMVGVLLCNFGQGSWMVECMGFGASVTEQIILWGAGIGIWNVAAIPRMLQEDEVLKKQFGKEWEEWASAVRWRIMPGVY
jgi:protein-S-isoprenylcysteine O-methyltransferase Ste14